jgi:hypothetical protein
MPGRRTSQGGLSAKSPGWRLWSEWPSRSAAGVRSSRWRADGYLRILRDGGQVPVARNRSIHATTVRSRGQGRPPDRMSPQPGISLSAGREEVTSHQDSSQTVARGRVEQVHRRLEPLPGTSRRQAELATMGVEQSATHRWPRRRCGRQGPAVEGELEPRFPLSSHHVSATDAGAAHGADRSPAQSRDDSAWPEGSPTLRQHRFR